MSGQSARIPKVRVALRQAEALGFTVRVMRRTGEVLVGLPGEQPYRVNTHRKDASAELIRRLEKRRRQLEEEQH